MSKDNSRLSRLGVLAPAALSACMDASVLAVPAAGAIVSTVLKELSKAFMLKKWFHGMMSAKDAEKLMLTRGKNGSYLVRESLTRPGELVLTVRVRGRVSHVMIRRQNDKYDVGSGEQFEDLVGLIEHFRSYPIVESSGDVLRLLQPLSGTRLRAQDIDKKVQEMQDFEYKLHNNRGFDGEFQVLKILDERLEFTTKEGMKPENACKNRYRNVLPYDQTRVVLHRRTECDSDYINANYVRGTRLGSNSSVNSSTESIHSEHSLIREDANLPISEMVSKSLSDESPREDMHCNKLDNLNGNICRELVRDKLYIATQGCLSNTIEDFWRMVWQEDVRVIAMITNEVEKGKKKCERYWPTCGEAAQWGDVRVRTLCEVCHEDYVVRELSVSDGTTTRSVHHYQFTTWPDHGTPEGPGNVLALIDDINRKMYQVTISKNAPEHNVLCVHCSAGVGRTGTFIALDMLIDKIKSSGLNCAIDVHATVKVVRAQRSGMVQNKAQYRFIYLALQEYILHHAQRHRRKVFT